MVLSYHISFLNVYLEHIFALYTQYTEWKHSSFSFGLFQGRLGSHRKCCMLKCSTFWSLAIIRKINDMDIRQSFLAVSFAPP